MVLFSLFGGMQGGVIPDDISQGGCHGLVSLSMFVFLCLGREGMTLFY